MPPPETCAYLVVLGTLGLHERLFGNLCAFVSLEMVLKSLPLTITLPFAAFTMRPLAMAVLRRPTAVINFWMPYPVRLLCAVAQVE